VRKLFAVLLALWLAGCASTVRVDSSGFSRTTPYQVGNERLVVQEGADGSRRVEYETSKDGTWSGLGSVLGIAAGWFAAGVL